MTLPTITLTAPCLIAGAVYPQGTELTASEAAVEAGYKDHQRLKVRNQIKRQVGDSESLLGTTSDAAALALYAQSVQLDVLASHGSAAIKDALAKASDGKLLAFAKKFRADVESGAVVLPALDKGIEAAATDIGERASGVAAILKQASAA